jgi:glycosyltransferase involved in cell wall biosynthesis
MFKNLKICIISPAYWPAISYGGPINSVKLVAEELAKFGNKVSVFTSAFGLNENKNKKEIVNDVEVYYFKYFTFKRWFISFSLLKELWKQKNKFDIFHINLVWDPISWMSGFLLALLCKKIIISPRGTVEKELILKRSYLLKKIIYFLFIKFVFKKAPGFHFTSEIEKDKFFEYTKINKPYKIILNPFNADEFEKKVDKRLLQKFNLENKKYILYLGRINWKKRIEILIDAFYEFIKNNKDFYLVVAGSPDKDYFLKLKEKINRLKLNDKVFLIGETITGDLKLALYQNAYCFVLPSISENFGYVVLEALASNIPVIISEGVGLKELVYKYNAGLILENKNNDDLVKDIVLSLEKLKNLDFVKKLIENGNKLLESEFNNKILAKKTISFYKEIL